ncbi:MAG: glycosyltransferase family 39 protein [Planctomycetota bacterium]
MTKVRSKSARGQRGSATAPAVRAASVKVDVQGAGPPHGPYDLFAHVAVPGLFLVFVWLWHPFHDVFEFDPDEGNNVIKALMLARGHPLYTEIWSDQPPLFTYMLRGWFALTDWTVAQARLLVLLCSAVLVWTLYQTVRLSWGRVAALAAAFMLVTSYRYLALSVSVMLGLPTLMFAMLSIYTLVRYRQRPHGLWLAASGVFLVLSLFTKLFALLVAPLILGAVLLSAWSRRREPEQKGHWLRAPALWCGSFVLSGAILFLLTVPIKDLTQLLQPHLDARKEMSGTGFDEVFRGMVKADYAFALLGLVGLLQTLRKRAWFSLVPAVWCGLAYVSLGTHRPLWYHHYPLLGVPLCWIGGIGMGALFSPELWRSCWPWRGPGSVWPALTLSLSFSFGALAATHLPSKFKRERDYAQAYAKDTPSDRYTVAVLKQFRERTDYAVTDRQIFAFSAGMIVPPELSVTSVKRMRSGHLSMETLIGLLQRYQPGVIHFSWRKRIPMTRELNEYLATHYSMLYADPRGNRCYVLQTLAVDPLETLERAAAEVPGCWEGQYNLSVQLADLGREQDAARALAEAKRLKALNDR